ncbi:hypothetical protein EGW08_021263 [Elysia chlorotica]|uniref:Uncharacterized protein n=1 Tax=Elysia chlorotica TaxID=188477 RepID=A0A3S0ZB99_ELYCH|nr:hypothetical protein EGW08_021263 [Elysia chlorotica]
MHIFWRGHLPLSGTDEAAPGVSVWTDSQPGPVTMNEHAMTQGVIPVRHSHLPGVVKLPKRYEKAALGDSRTARHRKFSICTEPARMRETISGRLDDLMAAIMWVKQELILLRQHDILLKRQFLNINDSIQTLHARKAQLSKLSSTSTESPALPHATPPLAAARVGQAATPGSDRLSPASGSLPTMNGVSTSLTALNGLSSSSLSVNSNPTSPARMRALLGLRKLPPASSDLQLDAFHMRPSSSATVLNCSRREHGAGGASDESGDDTDGDDTFDEDFYRPRTSSMRTSRDLAALARRRGSKELNQLL